jgi:hypothetical protein
MRTVNRKLYRNIMNRRHFTLSAAGSLLALPVMLQAAPARAQLVNKPAEQLANGEFNWFPERSPGGPVLIIVSIPDQRLHVYRNGIRVAASTVSTGKPGHRTPTGVFKILQKDKHHHSSTYNNAPMPNMNRLTWSGIALHAGQLPGYPASHGCVRLPLKFSEMLFGITKLGMTVVICDEHTQPASVVHPGLVLGDYARNEFEGVDVAIKKSQYSEGHATKPKTTSVVVSRADSSVTIFENDKIVATGKAEIAEPQKPLGSNVYTLRGSDSDTQDLHWSSTNYSGKGDREDKGHALRRIKADKNVREAMRERLQHGMTLVTTDVSATPETRSSGDFVVLDGTY